MFSDLEPNEEYEVRVRAATAKGFSNLADHEWPWISQRTGDHAGTGGGYSIIMTPSCEKVPNVLSRCHTIRRLGGNTSPPPKYKKKIKFK